MSGQIGKEQCLISLIMTGRAEAAPVRSRNDDAKDRQRRFEEACRRYRR